ncbi:hypothetical protein H1S01_09630 [Heliobacterium chlorum]|uniref:Uncharacterized protein n=1 Tax=Heliobacterium chlorum TaxID=2698 RepID=A0ABR7T348_HELCL|nr:CC/Se motif family (seleno)protein [Heliobacterium chlorum]MBC9784770.1 hypothetical protein [Heliobacterium chlorum]
MVVEIGYSVCKGVNDNIKVTSDDLYTSWSFTPAAKEFIERRGGTLRIDAPIQVGCCIHLDAPPEIQVGLPKRQVADRYEKFELEGFTVYQAKGFDCGYPLTIDLSRYFIWPQLVVKGWKLV